MGRELVTIPLNQLKPSAINVRKTNPLQDVEQLAASIESKGLLENLIVRQASRNGAERTYEVIAGGRRLAALKLLAKRKKIDKDHAVSCRILNGSQDADLIEVSLAENMIRAPMHPADQFDAFAKLQEEGLSADDVAARFGILPAVVLQRLKLAAVSPRLIAEYRAETMTLEQLMAFTISDDRDAQERFWFENPVFDRSPDAIRRYLVRSHVAGTDRRARFVGVRIYEEAGGVILRDLFEPEGAGFFADSQLLDRLVADKLDSSVEGIKSEGWGWVEVQVELDYAHLAKFGRIKPTNVTLSKSQERRITKLCERYDELVTDIEDGAEDDAAKELKCVSSELDALRGKKETWSGEEMRGAGVVVSLEYDGTLRVDRGLVRRSDRDSATATKVERKASIDGHPEALLVELSAERTAALREVLAGRPQDALTTLLFALVSDVFFGRSLSCLDIVARPTELARFSKQVGQSKASEALLARHARWQELLPARDNLWHWLGAADAETRLDLLAYCVAIAVDAVYRRGEDGRRNDANMLAESVALDMSSWWRPTAVGYFDRLTMEQIVRVVTEACSPEAARRLHGLKKGEMSQAAEAMTVQTKWLPSPLRAHAVGAEEIDTAVE